CEVLMIDQLRKKMKTLALLDAIIEQEWEYRYFSYNANWSDSAEMGSLRDGSGGEWFLWLCGDSAGYKCFSPEDGLMSDVNKVKAKAPSAYNGFITEPAFSMDHSTCIWYLENSQWVKYGKPVKWVIDLEVVENWMPADYHAWATDYYERDLDPGAIEKIFDGEFSEAIARKLNPEIKMRSLVAELPQLGVNS
ncbi:hypothetical protein KJ865_03115, partial [Myxococcota bacterium]|nr:hypothetical protein [Myxococcota bacterium]